MLAVSHTLPLPPLLIGCPHSGERGLSAAHPAAVSTGKQKVNVIG